MFRHRKPTVQLAGLIIAGITIRFALLSHVGVWGDYGFWAYDARLIASGQQPFVDFMGRSPLMVFFLAVVWDGIGHGPVIMRSVTILLWSGVSLVVYALGREIHGHAAGLTAAAAFLLAPYSIVYGMWLNSQALMALLSMTAAYLVVRWDTPRAFALTGVLLGSAFLSRRSVAMIGGGIALFALWRLRTRPKRFFVPAAVRMAALAVGGLGVLLVGYAAAVGFDPANTTEVFRIDALGLISSGGTGSFPVVGVELPNLSQQVRSGRIPIFNDICQLCGPWTARIGFRMLLLSLPVSGLLWFYTRDVTDRYMTGTDRWLMFGVLGVLGVVAVVVTALRGYPIRVLGILVIAGFGIAVYRLADRRDAGERALLYSDGMVLILFVLGALIAGYLYRNRPIHAYYLMDLWPWISVLAGVLGAGMWAQFDGRGKQAIAVLFVLGVVVSGATASPFVNVAIEGNPNGWFTTGSVAAYAIDIDSRTDSGDVVLAAQPAYVADSHARLPMDVSRNYMIGFLYANTSVAEEYYRQLRRMLRSGEVRYVVLGGLSADLIAWDDASERAFESKYCRVTAADGLYNRTNAALYRYHPTCPERLRPDAEADKPPQS